ncbi:MAG: D-alanyl-D-alanine carboxypeptidase family protein [Clostridia bacterium]|nr:D-alanyl-D-alanine carboxypeptidase family protein [Clostridia bacterium]
MKDKKKSRKKKITKRDIIEYSYFILSMLLIAWICYLKIPEGLDYAQTVRETLTDLRFEQEEYYIYVGEELEPTFQIAPATAITYITLSSSDANVAVVSDDLASITGNSAGSITITATGTPGVRAQAVLNVVAKQLPPDSDLPSNYEDVPMIANADRVLSPDYVPENMVVINTVPITYRDRMLMADALEAYEKLYADAVAATGQNVFIISGYRSYSYQENLFSARVRRFLSLGYSKENAEIAAGKTTQPPGHSEHQLGNSLDLSVTGDTSYSFCNTKVGAWITAHAHEYGYILRYPADKVEITEIDYEPWHFRYVGIEHAKYIYEHKLCLEEYIALQAQARQAVEDYSQQITAQELFALNQNENK